eukprot:3982014-Pleurochrysis_carterae.AAC.4
MNASQAVAALRHCDRLCTLMAVQSHCVKNTAFLKFSIIQHTFTQLLPMPRPAVSTNSAHGSDASAAQSTARPSSDDAVAACNDCLWRSPMLYATQLDLMLLLQRITEHFAASAFTLDHTRAIDAVRMVVMACIAAVADCVMRQIATDVPSEVCAHLRGGVLPTRQREGQTARETMRESRRTKKEGRVERRMEGQQGAQKNGKKSSPSGTSTGFSVGAGLLARQAASVAVHTAELNLARTCALDYFGAQSAMPTIFAWEKTERLEKSTSRWLQAVCADLAFPADSYNMPRYIADPRELICKNFPEFRCYRDVMFYFKLFFNPDVRRFPPKVPWSQKDAELSFHWGEDSERFYVSAFQDKTLSGRPRVRRGEMPPSARFGSKASPSEYTKPYFVESEDDVLHMWELPDFGELDVGHVKALGQHDAELLLSYLTVPYLRVPLVAAFFASDDRIHSLQSPVLQARMRVEGQSARATRTASRGLTAMGREEAEN